jgi:hypothetical protein
MIPAAGKTASMDTVFNGDPFAAVSFVRRIEAYMGTHPVIHSSYNLLDFMVHFYKDDPHYAKLHPARAAFDAAMAAYNALNGAIDAEMPEPKGVGRVPIPDEPKDLPDSASAKAVDARRRTVEMRASINEGTRKTFEFALTGLRPVDIESLQFLCD